MFDIEKSSGHLTWHVLSQIGMHPMEEPEIRGGGTLGGEKNP